MVLSNSTTVFVVFIILVMFTFWQTVHAYSSMSLSQRPLNRQVETRSAETLPLSLCTTDLPGTTHEYRTSVPMSVPLAGRQAYF